MATNPTKESEAYLEALVEELEIPSSRYKAAEASYKSLGEWLHRPDSKVRDYDPDVYVQGSFKLGTAIKPQSADEEYDVDCVCSLEKLTKSQLSQSDLKRLVGNEVKAYRDGKGIKEEVREGRRCWTLNYSDSAQFHMDIVPAIPNESDQRTLLESKSLDASYAKTAIAITDNEVFPAYETITWDWPRSNPRGYAEWFKERMGDEYIRRSEIILNEMRGGNPSLSIEDIPTYQVRTPLQSAIMILKRHRDNMFSNEGTIKNKPISIIISTLAARSYNNEGTIGQALISILMNMKSKIEYQGGRAVIKNPTDELENFADKWEEFPERERAFYDWLEQAQIDFNSAAILTENEKISAVLKSRMGDNLTTKAGNRLGATLLAASTAASTSSAPNVAFGDSPIKPKKPEGFA